MIETSVNDGIAIVAPDGHYAQAEFGEALRRVLAACVDGHARCLIMDFTRARGVETHSVVRIRETTRDLADYAPRFGCRCAVVVPSGGVRHIMEVGGVISRSRGIDYVICGDMAGARQWALESSDESVCRRGATPTDQIVLASEGGQ